uniref:Uncharacterized protein n=1 Tax=Cacopsylla melanoneura TaxID=428564 RepID=A0A8D8X7J6_9HEMI
MFTLLGFSLKLEVSSIWRYLGFLKLFHRGSTYCEKNRTIINKEQFTYRIFLRKSQNSLRESQRTYIRTKEKFTYRTLNVGNRYRTLCIPTESTYQSHNTSIF